MVYKLQGENDKSDVRLNIWNEHKMFNRQK